MPEHVQEWLGAYLDGELKGRRLADVQQHLETCPACRAALDDLRELSSTLRAAPLPENLPQPGRFAANLKLKLPRKTQAATKPRAWLGWLVPLGLMSAWLLIEVVYTINGLFGLVAQFGLVGESGGAASQTVWFALASQFPLGDMTPLLWAMNDIQLFAQNLLARAIFQALPPLLSLAWLAYWMKRAQKTNHAGVDTPGLTEGV